MIDLAHIESSLVFGDSGIKIVAKEPISQNDKEKIEQYAKSLKPWRKGPFYLFDLYINAEWQSFIKWNLLKNHLKLEGKVIADVGCNNGYYMFEMLKFNPAKIIGFDPVIAFKKQFDFINHFVKSDIEFELLGVENLVSFCKEKNIYFDVIFCLGVLYHRSDPIKTLKSLSMCLKKGGELILDTLIIESNLDICLSPAKSYAKMSNTYFIPSISALQGWCERAKLKEFSIIALKPTNLDEQRKTKWIDSMSLDSFLDGDKTIEGYPPPIRGYFKLKKL